MPPSGMNLCRLPKTLLVVYLVAQISLSFAAVITADTTGQDRYCRGWRCEDRRPHMAFIHLISIATILRSFYLLSKVYAEKNPEQRQVQQESMKCPFRRAVRCVGALAHEIVMISIWIIATTLAFVARNVPTGIIASIILGFQILQAVSVLIELLRQHFRVRSPLSSPTASSESGDDYQAVGPMFIPRYQDYDADAVEKGHPSAGKLGHGLAVRDDAEEKKPRVSEDTVADFEESDRLLKD